MLDVAVIGGGIVGASAAYQLVRAGARVALIDAEVPGRATAAGAGILPPDEHFARAPELRELIRWAREHYPRLMAQLAEDGQEVSSYEVAGALQVARTESELQQLDALRQNWIQLRMEGFGHIGEVRRLSPREARRRAPVLGEDVRGALLAEGSARIDGRRLLHGLREAFRLRGGRLVSGRAEPVREGDAIAHLVVEGEIVRASSFLVSCGCWSSLLAAAVGVELPIAPERGQLLRLALGGAAGPFPTLLGFDFTYVLVYAGGLAVAGATRERAGYDGESSLASLHELSGRALQLAPGLGRAALSEVRVGLRPLTPDGSPIVGPLPGVRNAFVAAGHGSYGLELGPASGVLVADWMLGATPPVDLSAFSGSRF